MLKPRHTKANRLDDWGDSLMTSLPSVSRKRRKRSASKKRRVQLRREVNAWQR